MFHRTKRLLLRPLWPEDALAIAPLANDRRVADQLARLPHPYGAGDARQFISTAMAQPFRPVFAIQAHSLPGAPLIGCVGINTQACGGLPALGYWLGVPWWKQGYGTEAAGAALAVAFDGLGLTQVESTAFLDNPASLRVLSKLGFRPVQVTPAACLSRNAVVPAQQAVLTRDQWQARQRLLDQRQAA